MVSVLVENVPYVLELTDSPALVRCDCDSVSILLNSCHSELFRTAIMP